MTSRQTNTSATFEAAGACLKQRRKAKNVLRIKVEGRPNGVKVY